MFRIMSLAGVAAGLIAGGVVSLFATTLDQQAVGAWGMAIGYLTMLGALSAIFVAVKRYRDFTGAIGFWRALGMGLGVTLIASATYALCWEGALIVMGGPDAFIDSYVAGLRRDPGATAQVQQMQSMRASYRNPLIRLPLTMIEIAPVGVLVSLISAALLRNPRFLPARRTS